MDDASKGTLGSYADLLTDDYGGYEVYGEEWKILQKLFETDKPEEIIFTCDQDVDSPEEYKDFDKLQEEIQALPELCKEDYPDGGYTMYDFKGVKLVLHLYPFTIIFIKGNDREKFDELTKQFFSK